MINDTPCPQCGRTAPVVLRQMGARCSACGVPRNPLTTRAVNVAGRPTQVGGQVARVLGWVFLAGGLAAALLVGAIFQAIFPAGVAGYILGGTIAAVTLLVSLLLLIGGGRLRKRGEDVERDALTKAVYALAEHRGGVLTAGDVARTLDLQENAADALLTALAKDPDRGVSLDVDDDGRITYAFRSMAALRPGAPRVRVAPVARARAAPDGAEILDAELIDEPIARKHRRANT